MGEGDRNQKGTWQFAPGGRGVSSRVMSPRRDLASELQKYLHVLGPMPKRSLEIFADLGLSDDEIGRYFRMPCKRVTELREIWKIGGHT